MSFKPEIAVVAAIPPELETRLAADFTLVKVRPTADEALPHTAAVTTSMAGFNRALFSSFPNLKLIACNGTGLDGIDLEAAAARGVTVQNTPDSVTEDTADTAIGLLYATLRRLVEADRFMRSGRWGAERMTPSRRVSSRHMGIVGMGKIGKVVAQRAAALGVQVSYTARTAKSDLSYGFHPDVVSLAKAVDVLVLCCPGGKETEGLVDSSVLDALGPDGILINIARGSVVNEPQLLDALAEGKIGGAGLDVFASEPAFDQRFLAFENVVLLPHYASVTKETRADMANVLHAAISRHLASHTPKRTA